MGVLMGTKKVTKKTFFLALVFASPVREKKSSTLCRARRSLQTNARRGIKIT